MSLLGKHALVATAVTVTLLSSASATLAAPCPGTMTAATTIVAGMSSTAAGMGGLAAFIGTGCTHDLLGNADFCFVSAVPSFYGLHAQWTGGATERTMDATGGCSFHCNGMMNHCVVRNNGLPVELLRFGLD